MNNQKTFTILDLNGKSYIVCVPHNSTVSELKTEIKAKTRIPVEQQTLTSNKVKLNDNDLLKNCNIPDNIINLILRLRGGMFHETSGKTNFNQYIYTTNINDKPRDELLLLVSLLDQNTRK